MSQKTGNRGGPTAGKLKESWDNDVENGGLGMPRADGFFYDFL